MTSGVGLRASGIVLALVMTAVPAHAQTAPFSIRGAAVIGYEHFVASQTFEGMLGSANQPVYGGGVEIGMWRHLFVRVEATRFSKTGEKAFAYNNVVYKLGIPMTITVTPVMVTGGYRANIVKSIALYAGGGAGSWAYSQETDDPADADSFRKTGYLGLAGVEWQLQKWIAIGFEGQFARVPNAIGKAGVSEQLKETDLGGTTAAFRIIVGR